MLYGFLKHFHVFFGGGLDISHKIWPVKPFVLAFSVSVIRKKMYGIDSRK